MENPLITADPSADSDASLASSTELRTDRKRRLWVRIQQAAGDVVTTSAPQVTPVCSTSLATSLVLKASSGVHYSTLCQIDATAPTGTYYVQMLHRSATVPADGAVTHLHAPITVVHTNGLPDSVPFDDTGAPAKFDDGLCVVLSTTQFTKTAAGSYLIADGSVS